MKIEIMGYSGSGKSTLCQELAALYQVPGLHLDTVHWLPDWEMRNDEDKQRIVSAFLDDNKDGWVIDGNYFKLDFERRAEEADLIIQLLFGRINCLYRCVKRYMHYKGKSRPDITEGCDEKMDWEFVRWILWEGRSKARIERYTQIQKLYPNKVIAIKNQKQLNDFLMNQYQISCDMPYINNR